MSERGPADAAGPRKVQQAATSLDMFGGQTAELGDRIANNVNGG